MALSSTEKKPLQSKKWIAMMLGVICVMVVFVISVIAMIIDASIAANIVSLANTVVVFLGMTVSVLITGQSAVDWQHTSSLSSSTTEDRKTFIEKVELDIKQKNALVEQYQEKYKEDESYKPIDPEKETWK